MSLRDLIHHGLYGLGTLFVCVAVYALLRGAGGAWQAWRAGEKRKAVGFILALIQVAILLAALLVLMQTNGKGGLLLQLLIVAMPASGIAASVYQMRGAPECEAVQSPTHTSGRDQTLGT